MGSDTSGASAPELGSNLVGVTYDNGINAWVKTSNQEKWYNYEKKYWANAVILKNNSITYNINNTISSIKYFMI